MNPIFKVLASGSSGNCYALTVGEETLLLECGIVWKDILKGLDFNIKNVVGCLVTHEHKDHCKAIGDLIKNGIDIYTSKGTLQALELDNYRVHALKEQEMVTIGNFKVMPFEIQHDTAEPFGYLIYHKEIGYTLFATDTAYIKYQFDLLNNIFIECNYWDGAKELDNRVLETHMSLDNCKQFIRESMSEELNIIMLLHLSDRNSNARLFKQEIEGICGFPTCIAEKGLEIYL